MAQDEIITVRNFYVHCGETWEDDWSCGCNDMCPKCQTKDIEPYHSEEVETLAENWAALYRPISNSLVRPGSRSSIMGGEMFGIIGAEYAYVQSIADERVWTLVNDGKRTSILPGRHTVNREGYFITEVPYNLETPPTGFLWSIDPPDDLLQGDSE